ncbi:MAG: adenylate kinase [Erysipelotrichaceae bacterium]|nr:adenylate kinase [Erysipelotrichaceae bacterium]
MKRIIVIGCPGSGKSVFSIKLSNILQIPVIHLDNLYWNSDKTTVDNELFRSRLTDSIQKDSWIIDGNYISTMELRLQHSDTVFFLDYPVELCLEGVKSRKGKVRPDIPWIEEEEDEEFIQYIKDFKSNVTPKIYQYLYNYSDKEVFHLKTREEAECLLNQLEMRNHNEEI